MLNELHQLSVAMRDAEISTESWYRKYLPIPNIKPNAPCIRIVLEGEQVAMVESLSPERGRCVRKFGDNQGSFPAMNLAPLYCVSEEEQIAMIRNWIKNKGEGIDLQQVKSFYVTNNWGGKFAQKYKLHTDKRPKELLQYLGDENEFEPLMELIQALEPFKLPEHLHGALEETAFQMIKDKRDISLALQILFYLKRENGPIKDNLGTLSVVFDTFNLEDIGLSVAGSKFTAGLNASLLSAEKAAREQGTVMALDAFGLPFSPLNEPMPQVKLPAGFTVSLRTMFRGNPCQHRYGRIESGSYPISGQKRAELKVSLEWLSGEEMKNKTWVSLGKDEALFVYPSRLPEQIPELARTYNRSERTASFEAEAKYFSEFMTKTKRLDPEHYPDLIQLFILHKLDKARTKVIYSRNTTPEKIAFRSDEWRQAGKNLPTFRFKGPWIPFPLEISRIMNRVWKQDGTLASDRYKAVPVYHGLDLLFGLPESGIKRDLQILMRNSRDLAVYAGRYLNTHWQPMPETTLFQLRETLSLAGMLLYWIGSGKELYMNEYPYLLGQLLKVSDSLHELYCINVRDGQIPSQLVGGSMYSSAAEFPRQCIGQLGQRMMPYLNWARTHKDARFSPREKNGEIAEGPSAGYYLYLYNQIADRLKDALTAQIRFSDAEKAQLFIGYLASFPKKTDPQKDI